MYISVVVLFNNINQEVAWTGLGQDCFLHSPAARLTYDVVRR